MKKYPAVLTAAVMMLSGCTPVAENGREKTESPLVSSYLELAEEYYAAGDAESAINTLREGYNETGDRKIKNRLADLEKEEGTTE